MANTIEIKIPDIGGATDVDVIEIVVKKGDHVNVDDPLLTLEGDKATMEVPSSEAGVVENILVNVGDKVSEGSVVLTLNKEASENTSEASDESAKKEPVEKTEPPKNEKVAKVEEVDEPTTKPPAAEPVVQTPEKEVARGDVHAGPSVRRVANELDLDLKHISGTGPKGRITKEDIKNYINSRATGGAGGMTVTPMPEVDFSQFGETEIHTLNKIKRLTGAFMHRNWVTVPHVTQFSDADVTELEAFRKSQKDVAAKKGLKLTPLVFIMKAVVDSLKVFPHFNASLDSTGNNLILKKYFHIGIAVDTPNGLVVPVIRDVDQKSLFDLAEELGAISQKAREKGLSVQDMSGGCFTISSLGGIGGTAFTPIVNAPEVAILGVSRTEMKPVYKNGEFVPRAMLPLSLSYDHRVIDGAEGARFTMHLCSRLADIRTLLL